MCKMVSSGRPPLALIAGPTASGKSALALALAEAGDGVVINADASQVYADLRILSARPGPDEEARAPHRLFGFLDASVACSAAMWAAHARSAIAEAHRERRLPILVGGTGLYMRTLIDGIAPVPPIDPDVRAEVRARTVAENWETLRAEDPEAAARLRPGDSVRVARALEVLRSTGRPIRDWQATRSGGIGDEVALSPLVLLPPRAWLYARCEARLATMFAGGAVEEVRALRARGLDPGLPAMRAIGVAEIAAWQDGALTREAALAAAAQATRNYAKRQFTWFAHQPPAGWERHRAQLDNDEIKRLVIKLLDYGLTE